MFNRQRVLHLGQMLPRITQGTLLRGGSYNDSYSIGIYALQVVPSNTYNDYLGFRCVYKP